MKKVIQFLIIVLLSLVILVLGMFIYGAYSNYQLQQEFIQMLTK